jgi:hypothetical protein
MKVVILDDKLFEYALHVMQRYAQECVGVNELRPASYLWEALENAQDLPEPKSPVGEPFEAPDGALVVPIDGPLQVGVDADDLTPTQLQAAMELLKKGQHE